MVGRAGMTDVVVDVVEVSGGDVMGDVEVGEELREYIGAAGAGVIC